MGRTMYEESLEGKVADLQETQSSMSTAVEALLVFIDDHSLTAAYPEMIPLIDKLDELI